MNIDLFPPNKESKKVLHSSFIVNERSLKKLKSKSSKKSFLQSSQIKSKGKESNIDLSRLKEYIKVQEETEARLAMECSKT